MKAPADRLERGRRARETLELVGLAERITVTSGGQRGAAIARS